MVQFSARVPDKKYKLSKIQPLSHPKILAVLVSFSPFPKRYQCGYPLANMIFAGYPFFPSKLFAV